MSDNITPEHYRAEISMLNHEIYTLTKQLEAKEQAESIISDKQNPFSNPTEYTHYNGDYTEINRLIEYPGYKLTLEPAAQERKKLKKSYFAGGISMLLHLISTMLFSTILIYVIMLVLQFKHPEISYDSLYEYAYGSPAFVAVTMLTYLFANVGIGFLGLNLANVRPSSLMKTRDFTVGKAVKYCFCAIFIQYAAAIVSVAISDIVDKYGYTIDVMDDSSMAQTTLGMVLMIIYTCIIAPITEEFFYRGMLLKAFSKANQRFAIIASSVFFGLAHGNIRQFMLAFLLGMFLSHITMKHNSLLPSIIVHVFVNTSSTIINELSERGMNDKLFLIVDIIYILIAILGIAFLLEFRGKDKLPATTPHQSRRGLPVACSTITVVATFVLEIVLMISNILLTET